jgi:hypothetical protein
VRPDGRTARWEGSVHDLVTGRERHFARHEDHLALAAPSPDGERVAWLAVDDDGWIACGEPGGPGETFWRGPAGTCMENSISWSPDGRYIACTYLDVTGYPQEQEEWAVVVLSAETGEVVFHEREHVMPSSGTASWRGDAELVVVDDRGSRLVALDLEAGTSSTLARSRGIPVAISGDRLVRWRPGGGDDAGRSLVATDLDGGDERPLLALPAGLYIRQVDLVPAVDLDVLARMDLGA